MPLYFYKAIDKDGKRHNGKIDKENMDDARQYVKSQDFILIEVKKSTVFNTDLSDFDLFKPKVNKKDISIFCRQFSFIVDAGMDIERAFGILHKEMRNKTLKNVLNIMSEQLQKGESLSYCMERHSVFPPFLVNMVKVGELSGNLSNVMKQLALYYEKESKLNEEIKGAMLYPALVSVMMLFVTIMAVVFVVPNYSRMFLESGVLLPLPTRILIGISSFVILQYNFILLGLLLFILITFSFFKSDRGQYVLHFLFLNAPVIKKLYNRTINLRFSQTLGLLLKAGVQITETLRIVKAILHNKVLDRSIDTVILKMEQGENLGDLLKAIPCFEPMLYTMVQIGEETGQLPSTLIKCAEYFQNETDLFVSKLNKLIEPVITLTLGLLLAFIMIAIMLPTFTISDIL